MLLYKLKGRIFIFFEDKIQKTWMFLEAVFAMWKIICQ